MAKPGKIVSKIPYSIWGSHVSERRMGDGRVVKGYGTNREQADKDRRRKEKKYDKKR